MILLTDEEIETAIVGASYLVGTTVGLTHHQKIIIAQLKKVVEWLETKGHLECDEGSGDFYWEFDFIIRGYDWQALRKEIE